jgi:hypothetical protein
MRYLDCPILTMNANDKPFAGYHTLLISVKWRVGDPQTGTGLYLQPARKIARTGGDKTTTSRGFVSAAESRRNAERSRSRDIPFWDAWVQYPP